MSFEIKLPQFEGPFDLLLFFIERDELDIHDIPIAKITSDFLTYIHQLKELNIEVASEFILVAATLMRIKAKMLIPRKELDEAGNEIDPRQDLVERLLEYKKYKDILAEIQHLESDYLKREKRGNLKKELKEIQNQNSIYEELVNVDLYKLLKAFEKALFRFEERQNQPKHVIVQYKYTIEEQKTYLLSLVKDKPTDFLEIMKDLPDKIGLIFTFLAILELVQMQEIKITVGEGYNNFWLNKKAEKDAK